MPVPAPPAPPLCAKTQLPHSRKIDKKLILAALILAVLIDASSTQFPIPFTALHRSLTESITPPSVPFRKNQSHQWIALGGREKTLTPALWKEHAFQDPGPLSFRPRQTTPRKEPQLAKTATHGGNLVLSRVGVTIVRKRSKPRAVTPDFTCLYE